MSDNQSQPGSSETANRIASRANRISVIALVLSTTVSVASLVVVLLQAQKTEEASQRTIANYVVSDADVNIDNHLVYKIGNHSSLTMTALHVHSRTAMGDIRNYNLGTLAGCSSVGLYINRDQEKLTDFSFTDPYGRSWRHDANGTITAIESIDTSSETALNPLTPKKPLAPAYDETALPEQCEFH